MDHLPFSPLGDTAVTVHFGEEITSKINEKVRGFIQHLEKVKPVGMIEAVAGFTSVTVYYDPMILNQIRPSELPYTQMVNTLAKLLKGFENLRLPEQRTVTIPVCYGGEYGPDIVHVAKINRLTVEEVISIHTEAEYLVYMIGFAPGFPYLGGMSERIATPRRAAPRLHIPSGTVGIGGKQTGVYPVESPGGWQLIGRTPLQLFLPDREQPSLLLAGDIIRFKPISLEEFHSWKEHPYEY